VGGTGGGPWTPQGVDNDDPNATQGYFIGVDNAVFSRLVLRRISNPGGTPSISANLNLTVPTTTFPTQQAHKGDTLGKKLDALDDACLPRHSEEQNHGAISLWTAHNIQVNSSGVASSTGGRNGSRWYEISNLTGTPSLCNPGPFSIRPRLSARVLDPQRGRLRSGPHGIGVRLRRYERFCGGRPPRGHGHRC